MVAKAIVVRKSLGPKRPCEFESHPRHNESPQYEFCGQPDPVESLDEDISIRIILFFNGRHWRFSY